MRYTLLFFFLMMLTAESTMAQTGIISGSIADKAGAPVAYATVTLFRSDTTVAGGALTEEDGSFTITEVRQGSYLLRINGVGYEELFTGPYELQEGQSLQAGKISVSGNVQTLSEVRITAEKSLMEMAVDKKIFNVEKDLTTAGGTAADVLKNVPSVSVDVDGNVSLRGKEATILIDGKPATLLGGDVNTALQSMSASGIQTVEVISNPSARYDAQGMNGIINIVTKRNNKFGINGSVSVGAGTGDKYNGSINLSLRNNRWSFFLNSNFRRNRSANRNYQEQYDATGIRLNGSYEEEVRKRGGWFTSVGAEYKIDEYRSIGISQQINDMLWGGEGHTVSYPYHLGLRDSFEKRYAVSKGTPLSSSTSLDYKHLFRTKGRELTANATFAHTWSKRAQEYHTSYYTPEETPYKPDILQRAPSTGSNTSLNVQADYTTPFLSPDGRLDAGLKSQLYRFESANQATIDSGSGPQPDLLLQNDYNYTQEVYAGYVSTQQKSGRFSYQAGLRLEYSKYEGTSSAIGGQRYTNEFLNLFPSAYISYDLKKNQEIYLSYTRRINRPSFFRLMPFIDVSNPRDTSAGNPGLRPEFIHHTEVSYSNRMQKGHTFIASAYYQYTENMMDRIRRFNAETGNSFSRSENLGSGTTYGLEFTGRFQLLPIWDATLNANFFRNEIDANIASSFMNTSGTGWFTKISSNLKLPEGFSLQVNGNYEAPRVAAQGEIDAIYWADIALRKTLFEDRANLVLNLSDLFNTRKRTTRYALDTYEQIRYSDRETRIAQVTLTWYFGKSDIKSNNRRKGNQPQERIKDRDNLRDGDSDQGNF